MGNENHAKSEVNHTQAGIEEGPVHDGEGNLMSKVNSNTAGVGCSQDKDEKLSNKGTMEDLVDEVVGNVESVDADLRSKRTQAEESTLEISAKQLYENGGSVVWAECSGSGLSWFPAILPKLSASNIASSISYILPFPAKAASNLVQLFDAEGSWKRVEVVQPLGEDREVDEERLRMEGNLIGTRLAYGKALQYQSGQIGEKVTELELNISNSGDNENTEAVEKQKDLKEFVSPKHIEPKSRGSGKRSKSALRNRSESKSKSKRKRISSIVTRSQSVQRETSQAREEEGKTYQARGEKNKTSQAREEESKQTSQAREEEEGKKAELPFYALLPRGLTLTRLKGGQ